MEKETLSIVVPVRNRPGLIIRCLESIRSQSYRPLRVIVVDNGSTDDTAARVTEYIGRHSSQDFSVELYSEPTPGACAARNRGLREVKTRMVSFFDSDDTMRPDLAEMAMAASADADMVVWRTTLPDAGGRPRVHGSWRGSLLRRHLFNGVLSTQSYIINADFLRKAGGWNEQALVWNDWELGVRLLLSQPEIRYVDRPLVDIHPTRESITGTGFHQKRGLWERTLSIVEAELRNSGAPRHIVEAADYRRAILAAKYRAEGHPADGDALLEKTLSRTMCGLARRILLRLIYVYTANGGRGAYLLWH